MNNSFGVLKVSNASILVYALSSLLICCSTFLYIGFQFLGFSDLVSTICFILSFGFALWSILIFIRSRLQKNDATLALSYFPFTFSLSIFFYTVIVVFLSIFENVYPFLIFDLYNYLYSISAVFILEIVGYIFARSLSHGK